MEKLFQEFPAQTSEDWRKVALLEIGGKEPFENLKWTTPDGQEVLPYYSAEDTMALDHLKRFTIVSRHSDVPDVRSWRNMPMISVMDAKEANHIALEHLQCEADGILFENIERNVSFDLLLNNISWEHCTVSFLAGADFPFAALHEYIERKGFNRDRLQGFVFTNGLMKAQSLSSQHHGFTVGGIFVEGSTPVNEITNALMRAVNLIENHTEKQGLLKDLIKQIAFCVPVSPQLIIEVSKLRALRLLWYQVARAYGINDYQPDDLYIHAVTKKWQGEAFQPHANMLSGTISAIAAISGGCNALTTRAEDEQNPTRRRIARNTSTILKAESHLNKTNDPLAGAYATEVLTDMMARDVWKQFQTEISRA
jgi:methylmalonyl-CoA mutase